MALRSPSSTPRRDLVPRDSPPSGSPPPTSQRRGRQPETAATVMVAPGDCNGRDLASLMGDWRRVVPLDTIGLCFEEGGSRNRARADVARRTKEVEHLLANLEKEGVEIDDKITSIIDGEVARIKTEVARENIVNQLKLIGEVAGRTVGCIAVGFLVGAKSCQDVIHARIAEIFFG